MRAENDDARQPFSFRVLRAFPTSSEEKPWREFLARADYPAHYVAPEYFLEPYWARRRPFAVLAMEGDEIAAILTGIHERNFTVSGNTCRPQACFDPARDYSRAVDALARGLLVEAGSAELVTIYAWAPMKGLQRMGFRQRVLTGSVVLDLRQGPDVLFRQLHKSRRANVRYAMKQGVEVFQACSEEDVTAYCSVYSRWTTRKKLPRASTIPSAMLAEACKLQGNRRLFLARHAGQIIAGLSIRFSPGGLLENEQSASLGEYLHLYPNDLLIWKTIEWGCTEGLPRYSMNGSHTFFLRTGGTLIPVYRHQLDRTWLRRHDLREFLEGNNRTRAVVPVIRSVLRRGRALRAAFTQR